MSRPSPSEGKKAKIRHYFATLYRLATTVNHRYVYEWTEDEGGTISVSLFVTDPMTGDSLRVVKLLDQFTRWEEAGLLASIDIATPRAIARVEAYLDVIDEKLERDTPLLKQMIRRDRRADRTGSRLSPIKDEDGDDFAAASSDPGLEAIDEEEEPNSAESESAHLETNLEDHEEEDSREFVDMSQLGSILKEEEKEVKSGMKSRLETIAEEDEETDFAINSDDSL